MCIKGKILGCLFFISFFQLSGQENLQITPDEKFLMARDTLFAGKRDKARKAFKMLLQESPNYIDARLLLGRAYSWDKQFDSAYFELSRVIEQKKDYLDAWKAIIDNENWAKRYLIALNLCERALVQFPEELAFQIKKSEILLKSGRTKEALLLLKQLKKNSPDSLIFKKTINRLVGEYGKNKIVIKQYYEYHKVPYIRNWMITSIGYSSKTKIGTVIGRINTADFIKQSEGIWKETGHQFEVESYPKVHKKVYLYLNYAYNPNGLFPKHRSGFEAFVSLPYSFESSIGFRFMRFESSTDSSFKNIMVYTASGGKYYKNFWFSLRTYLTPKSQGWSKSLYLSSRRYFKNGDNYVEIITGMGASPDEYGIITSSEINMLTLNRYSLKAGYSDRIGSRWLYSLRAGYEYQEFRDMRFRHLMSLTVQLGYKF